MRGQRTVAFLAGFEGTASTGRPVVVSHDWFMR
jgi:hypothetical protein